MLRLLNKGKNVQLFGKTTQISDKLNAGDVFSVNYDPPRWLSDSESPTGEKVLYMKSFAENQFSLTDEKTLEQFEKVSSMQLEDLHIDVNDFEELQSHIAVPRGFENLKDGKVHQSDTLEDKWNIYKKNNAFIFSRSWTGEVAYIYRTKVVDDEIFCGGILVNKNMVSGFSTEFIVYELIFLTFVYLNKEIQPHPIPISLGDDTEKCAKFSFHRYGKYAYLGKCTK